MIDTRLDSSTSATLQPELAGERLRLRRLRPADAALLSLYCSDPRVARMTTSIPHPYPPGAADAFIARSRAPGRGETVWALDTGTDGENGLVGAIAMRRRDATAEIGYWVAPAFWGAGYAGEAVEAVAAHAAGLGLGLETLTAQVFQDNLASVRVLTRAGFAYAGATEAYSVARAAMVPVFCYRRALTHLGDDRR